MKTLGIIIFLTIFISVGAIVYLSWSERENNSFENYQSVVDSGLITRGWVPLFIPKSSYNINEYHAVDKPNIYVELYFKPEDISYFNRACTLLSESIYEGANSGYPIKVTITNDNHAIIESI